jgi:hypothetical protein
MSAIVVGATLVLLLALSSGPWAHAAFVDGQPGRVDVSEVEDDQRLDVDLFATGRIRVERGDADLAERYDAAGNAAQRAALRGEVAGSLRDLVQVVAVLVMIIAVVGMMRPLTPHTWAMVAAAGLACLLGTVLLRDDLTSALATHAPLMNLGAYDTSPTGWSALAVGAAGAATLTAALAAGPRPVRGTARSIAPLAADPAAVGEEPVPPADERAPAPVGPRPGGRRSRGPVLRRRRPWTGIPS